VSAGVEDQWLVDLFDAAELREADRHAIEDLAVPGVQLMEAAATALAEAVTRVAPNGTVVVVCGKGNNGGDGLAAARLLTAAGREVEVFATCSSEEWNGDAALMFDRLGAGVSELPPELPSDAICVIDCVLGTGASGAPRGAALDAVEMINSLGAHGARVIACDIPSGVDASTGEVPGVAVQADITVSFHAMKRGQWISPGKRFCGEVEAIDIGIPVRDDLSAQRTSFGLIKPSVVAQLPTREESGDKFAAGAVIVAGGSPGLTGAALLSGLGAARGGAGYVTVALPTSLLGASDLIPELMGLPLPEHSGSHSASGADHVAKRAHASAGAVVLGPGLGRDPSAAAFALAIADSVDSPLVVDADGIRAFAGQPELIGKRVGSTVMTPHEGELAALLGCRRDEVASNRLGAALKASAGFGCTLVLKGDDTLVCDPTGRVGVSRGGAPALATAGTGDVLSGLLGALLARGVEPWLAACAAVAVHAEAGRIAASQSSEGVLASDVAHGLPAARAALLRQSGL